MATQDFQLSSGWTQLTDGTQQASIQVISGAVYVRDAQSKPSANGKGHYLKSLQWLVATAPQKIWVRPAGNSALVIATFT